MDHENKTKALLHKELNALRQRVAELEQSEVTLQESREELEKRVAKRTQELSQANAVLQAEVSERRQAEMALRESEERFRILVEQSFDGIFVHENFRIVEVNQRMADISGYSCSELLGMRAIDLFTLESQKRIQSYILWGKRGYFELELQGKDGRIVQVESYGAPCRFHGREARIAAVRDISERKRSEAALQNSLSHLEATLNALPDLLFEVDRKGHIYDFRSPHPDLLYVTPEQFLGKTLQEVLPEEAAQVIYSALAEAAVQGSHRGAIYNLKIRSELHWFELSIAAMGDVWSSEVRFIVLVRDITDRKGAEEALKASEEQYRLLVKSIPAVVFKGYADWSVDFFDDKIEELTGYPKADFDSRRLKWCDVVLPEDLPTLKVAAQKALEGNGAYIREYRIRSKAGEVRWLQARGTIIRNSEGGMDYISGVFFDITLQKELEAKLKEHRDHLEKLVAERTAEITRVNEHLRSEIAERRRTEAALRESEEKYRTIVETAQEGVWLIDQDEKTVYVNRRLAEMLGYAVEEMLGAHLFKFLDEAGRQFAKENLCRGRQGEREVFEFRFRRQDGSDLWAILSTNPLFDGQGRYLGALGMLTDITKRHRAETALRESETRFRKIFEESPIGIVLRDLEGYVLESNPALAQIWGYSREELQGKNSTEVMHPEDEPRRAKLFQELMEGQRSFYSAEFRFFHKDGSLRWCHVHVSLIHDEHLYPRYSLALLQDITREKQVEAELGQYQENLRHLASELSLTEERERRRLAEFLHDDIGQTLALAKIKLGGLRQALASDPMAKQVSEVKEFLEKAIQSTRDLTFELSLPILYEMGLEEAVEWLAEQFQRQYGLIITVSHDFHPKPLAEGARVLLFRLVRELLTNVVKHAEANRVEISFQRQADYLNICLQDNGIGFDAAQGISIPRAGGGFGLFSVRERLSHLGGRMKVRSAKDKGTQITIIVPLQDAKEIPPAW